MKEDNLRAMAEIEYLKAENLQLKQQNQGLTQNVTRFNTELTELRTEHADLIKMRSALLDLYDKQEDELTELREVVRKVAEQKEGYDLFPVEPSDKMKDAGYAQSNDESKVMCGLIYKAMIAASKEEKR
jgi:predicted nuclease with TOPRIM domain